MHVHVVCADGEAKFWIDPEIEIARSYQLSDKDLLKARKLIERHEEEIRDAWNRHFGR